MFAQERFVDGPAAPEPFVDAMPELNAVLAQLPAQVPQAAQSLLVQRERLDWAAGAQRVVDRLFQQVERGRVVRQPSAGPLAAGDTVLLPAAMGEVWVQPQQGALGVLVSSLPDVVMAAQREAA